VSEKISPPNRRIVMELAIQADDRDSLLMCLDAVRQDVERGAIGKTTGGAGGFGYEARIADDGQTTAQQYAQDLQSYLESIRREGC